MYPLNHATPPSERKQELRQQQQSSVRLPVDSHFAVRSAINVELLKERRRANICGDGFNVIPHQLAP
jgi:hypothetical protein